MNSILITGATGQLGHVLKNVYSNANNVFAVGRDKFDLTKPGQMAALIRDIKPDIIVNTAAYTAVDKAESEPELAMQINGIAPGIIAEEAKRIGAVLIHFSTDYVFDGSGAARWKEEDTPNPINVYGKTKLEGEIAIQAIDSAYIILRTSWIYGSHGNNFLKTMLRLFNERESLNIVSDQYGAPTSTNTLAMSVVKIINEINNKVLQDVKGVYHLADQGETTWYGFACEIKNLTGSQIQLNPVLSENYKTAAKRPLNSRLSTSKILSTFELELPNWKDSLQTVYRDIIEGGAIVAP